jgi:hypothetical protein
MSGSAKSRQRFFAGTAFEDLRLELRAETRGFRRSSFLSEMEVAQDTELASLSSFRAMRIASAAGSPTSRSSLRATVAKSDMLGVCSEGCAPSSDRILVGRMRQPSALSVALSAGVIRWRLLSPPTDPIQLTTECPPPVPLTRPP